MSEKPKLNVKRTFLIGLGLCAISLSWSIYNSYVPIILKKYLTSTVLLGAVMALDNVFAVLVQPFFGIWSDKVNTRLGKRTPFILIGAPIAAAFFIFVPLSKTLASTMAVIIIFNFTMATWRAPIISLMPDVTPSSLRSKANGIINTCGGIGGVLAFLIGGLLFNLGGMPLPFLVSAGVMVLCSIVLALTVHERRARAEMGYADDDPSVRNAKVKLERVKLSKPEKKSLVFIIMSLFFCFFGFNSIETYFTLYAVNKFPGFSAGDATILASLFPLSYLVMAIPMGFLASKIGRKRTLQLGILVDIAVFILVYNSTSIYAIAALFVVGGMFWGGIVVNALPMVVEWGGEKHMGLFTSYYYLFTDPASIFSPIVFGWIYDRTGSYANAFIFAAASFAIAFFCLLFVKHGEASPLLGKPVPEKVMPSCRASVVQSEGGL
jgi:MFS family permease